MGRKTNQWVKKRTNGQKNKPVNRETNQWAKKSQWAEKTNQWAKKKTSGQKKPFGLSHVHILAQFVLHKQSRLSILSNKICIVGLIHPNLVKFPCKDLEKLDRCSCNCCQCISQVIPIGHLGPKMLRKPSFLFHPKIQKCFLIESLVSYQAIFPIDATIPVTQNNDSSYCINLQVEYQLANNQLQVHIFKTFHTRGISHSIRCNFVEVLNPHHIHT